MVNMFGLIKKVMKDFLKIIVYKEKDIITGPMGEIFQVNLIKVKRMDQGDISGPMGEFMLVSGKMENNMDQEGIQMKKMLKHLVFG